MQENHSPIQEDMKFGRLQEFIILPSTKYCSIDNNSTKAGEQGWRSGETERSPPTNVTRVQLPPSTKTNTSKFQLDQEYTALQAYSFNLHRV